MIMFSCDQCGTSLQALEENAGKKSRCQCGAIVPIPMAAGLGGLQTPAPQPPSYQPPQPAQPSYDSTAQPYASDSPYAPPQNAPSAAAPSSGVDTSAILWGIVMMVGGVVWFFAGLAAGRIFIYPPILFIIGIFRLIGGLTKRA